MKLGALFAKKTKRDGGYDFPAAAFAYTPNPDEPSTWKIRLWETPSTKETAAQIGRAAAALSAGGFRGNPAEIPAKDLAAVRRRVRAAWKRVNPGKSESAMPDGIKMSAAFSVTDPDADVVYHYGKLFEAGSWPDKRFSLTPDELVEAVEAFQPTPVDIEHRPSRLDGKLGQLEWVEATDDHKEIFGSWSMPRWLDEVLGDDERTVSLWWTPGPQKRIRSMALVGDPRIEDAVLMSAFSKASVEALPEPPQTFRALHAAVEQGAWDAILARLLSEEAPEEQASLLKFAAGAKRHDTRSGQSTIQDIHDTAARYGAVCQPGGAAMASQHEADALQQVHDLTMEHGAKCADMANERQPSWMFSGDPIIAEPETPAGGTMTLEEMFRKMFNLPADWKAPAEFSANGDPAPTPNPTPTPTPTPAPAADPTFAAQQAEMARLQDENRRLRLERIQGEAITFADTMIRDGRMFPAEREAFVATFTQAALDDAALPPTFSADGKPGPSRVDGIKQAAQARPAHQLDLEQLPADVLKVMQTFRKEPAEQGKGTDKESIDELMAMTARGKAALASRNGS